MPIPAALRDLIACPNDDHGALREHSADGLDLLVCTVCGTTFRVEGDLPVLLADEAIPASDGSA